MLACGLQVVACCCWLLRWLWDVLCSLWRQGGTDGRARGLKVGSTMGIEACQGHDGGYGAVLCQCGGFWGVIRVYLPRGVDPRFFLTPLGWFAGGRMC